MPACKKILLPFIFITAVFTAFSQNSSKTDDQTLLKMPSMPEMPQMSSSLNMPSISAPVAPSSPSVNSGNFYVPGFTNQTFVKSGDSKSASPSQNAAAGENESKAQTDSLLSESALSGGNNASSSASAKALAENLAKKNLLTSGDISSLYDSGLFGSISSLSSSDSKSTEILLQKILENLEELKQSQTDVSPEKKQELAGLQQDSKVFKSREPKILRFKIKGYNIADSITESFFSEAEADGSFLFTADRKYYVSGYERTETFYLLFKAIRSNGSAVTFEVIPSIVQDSENPNSFLYRLCQQTGLKAEKTGNLVSLHFSQNDLNVDLLLDIDIQK